jgi:hypothetical protein
MYFFNKLQHPCLEIFVDFSIIAQNVRDALISGSSVVLNLTDQINLEFQLKKKKTLPGPSLILILRCYTGLLVKSMECAVYFCKYELYYNKMGRITTPLLKLPLTRVVIKVNIRKR